MRFSINIFYFQVFMTMMTTRMRMKIWILTTSLHWYLGGGGGEAVINLTLEKRCGDGSVFFQGHTRDKANA